MQIERKYITKCNFHILDKNVFHNLIYLYFSYDQSLKNGMDHRKNEFRKYFSDFSKS